MLCKWGEGMKYYRFISETQIEEYDKKYVVIEVEETEEVDGESRVVKRKVQISHPSAETLLKAGIKPLTKEEDPTYNPDTQAVEYYYEDGETEIHKKWRIVEVSDNESVADA